MNEKLPYLNLGCGSTFDASWTNIDFVSDSEQVIVHNLMKGIPFPDKSFRVVYHSHMLEHMPREKGLAFLRECFRVLEPRGTIRVVIPDLEQVARNYIRYLEEALKGVEKADEKYEWTMLELYDQVVRTETGGQMLGYISDSGKDNDRFLLERNGNEVRIIMDLLRNAQPAPSPVQTQGSRLGFKRIKASLKYRMLKKLLGEDMEALRLGRFRLFGEVHQWMYDRYSLGKALKEAGFKEVTVRSAFESGISDWNRFGLDGKDGHVRKPDSLFMEARK
jgi:predicted SAM-dependent methyltransferase